MSSSHAQYGLHCDYFEARRIVGVFRPCSPVKMSDMEDDFMCDDEEDYDLVNYLTDVVLHACCLLFIGEYFVLEYS